jgi:hypothetical protein
VHEKRWMPMAMPLPGPLPISTHDTAPARDLSLRLNQRIAAEVVEVSGTKVVLSVAGTPVVARLETLEQEAELAGRRFAQFVVTSLSEGEVVLKLAAPAGQPAGGQAAPAGGQAASAASPVDITAQILAQLGLSSSPENSLVARALLAQGLAVTPDLMFEMQTFLAGLGRWGEADAALAAAIKAGGLPLTPGVFQFAAQRPIPTQEALLALQAALQGALRQPGLPGELAEAARAGLTALQQAVLDWPSAQQAGPERLRALVETFGRSLENALAGQAAGIGTEKAADGLLALGKLYAMCQSSGQGALAEKVLAFLQGVEQNSIANLRLNPVPGQGDWCGVQFVLQGPPGRAEEFFPARVRIARREQKEGARVEGGATRLVIQVDLDDSAAMQVDLTLAGRRIRAAVTTPDAEMQQRSKDELPALMERLDGLGFQVVGAQFNVGAVGAPCLVSSASAGAVRALSNRRVNIRV